jgi:predicted nucleic acid-binding protein
VIVVDASAAIEILLRLERAEDLMDRVFDSGETLHVPHLFDVEVAQVIRRYAGRGELTPFRAEQAIGVLRDFPVERYSHQPLLERIWQLRHNLTAYDAAYLSLAEVLDATLVTRDNGLAGVRDVKVRVEVF